MTYLKLVGSSLANPLSCACTIRPHTREAQLALDCRCPFGKDPVALGHFVDLNASKEFLCIAPSTDVRFVG